MRRRILLCAVAALALAGCTERPPTKILESPVTVPAAKLGLVSFESCDRLLTELRAATRRSISPYGLSGAVPANASIAGSRADAGMAAPATAYSGTNVHEVGADEPDIIKTDGRRIVTVDRGVLRVIDPATRTQTGQLELGTPADGQLLLAGDHALVLSSSYPQLYGRMASFRPSGGDADLILVDLSGPPRIISRYQGIGRVVDARQTGNIARVVLSSTPRIDFPSAATDTDDLLRDNRQAVTAAPLDAWLPSWQVTTGTSVSSGRLDCGAVSRPQSFSGAGMLTVLTFDVTAPALTDGDPVAVVSDGDIVYGTPSSLYVANDQQWRLNAMTGAGDLSTEIFQFALTSAGKPVLTASGNVPGTLLNQYSMSEWDGRLRVATTTTASSSSSAVRVLSATGGKLVQTGVVDGLGKGERIYSVRFLGSRGYVVTFRQTDPLYSLDLSDPAAPRVTGELKITGYSAHLQQVGDDLLVGVGQEASTRGVRQGLQVSLFDVADPARPSRLDQRVLADAVSNAEFDPHALLWWPATKLLVVPVKGAFDGALAFRVDAGGLKAAGRINGYVNRSLVIGDDLWTLGENGMNVAALSTLEPIGSVAF
ncbi:beta-propeller domain-containing protein [Paractinoplanes durhamensis]|uniref:Beta propeller domain-containing protein n=1 Tax=Paractinoplanes durhamensis TaxID=113563 RepID=A0ABQ3Z6D4_9ACTN|nr:beta-propeller domain-containing protein [Actinoplanes durhamensis]GIE05392.1 hypothetical protein Adu01nite_67420 [Actinoplanes durhamensis]